MIGTIKKQLIN